MTLTLLSLVEIPAELRCPEAKLQDCAKGEANVITHVGGCPVYSCGK